MRDEIRICIIRHGRTPGNIKRGYIGCRTDEDLDVLGRKELREYKERGIYPDAEFLYLSPMKRCRQTAEIIWPELLGTDNAENTENLPGNSPASGKKRTAVPGYEIIQDFRECDFGDFDGKSYSELNGVPDFQHWVDSNGMGRFPGGEDPEEFRERTTRAFLTVVEDIFCRVGNSADTRASNNAETILTRAGTGNRVDAAISAHGGTVMSVMAGFGTPGRTYYDWHVWNGDGFEVTVRKEEWERTHRFSSIRKLLPEEDRQA